MSVAAVAAGCADGGAAERTEPPPPSRLTVTIGDEGAEAFRVPLDCDVADRATCAEILAALRERAGRESCGPGGGGPGRIVVEGTIEGARVRGEADRATDCGERLYEWVLDALGPAAAASAATAPARSGTTASASASSPAG